MCTFCNNNRVKIEASENTDEMSLSREESRLIISIYCRAYLGELLEEENISFQINHCPICGRNLKRSKQTSAARTLERRKHDKHF